MSKISDPTPLADQFSNRIESTFATQEVLIKPPSYQVTEDQPSRKRTNPLTRLFEQKIRATDTPKWRWTQSQCREWIAAVLMTYLEYSPCDAATTAGKFIGCGPNIYLSGVDSWAIILKSHIRAQAIRALIMTRRNRWGAVPWGIQIGIDR